MRFSSPTRRTTRLLVEVLEDRTVPSSSPAYGQLPLAFEPNQGQAGAGAAFVAHQNGATLSLSSTQATLAFDAGMSLQFQLVGANPQAQAVRQDPLVTRVNYLTSQDPSQWVTNVPTFGQLTYQNVYPGIAMDYHGNQGNLEYDFTVAPGANPGVIRLAVQGAQNMSLDAQGNLVLHTTVGDLVEEAPVLYQEVNGVHQSVTGRFVLEGDNQVGFAVGAYNHALPLVIDPTLSYASYLPSPVFTEAVDSSGAAYVGGEGAFVAKMNPTGTALIYETFFGGGPGGLAFSTIANEPNIVGIAVDAAGDAYLTGVGKIPTTANAFSSTQSSRAETFVAELNPAGSGMLYSTYLPGAYYGYANSQYYGNYTSLGYDGGGIAVSGAGAIYVTGPAGTGLPTTAGAYLSSAGPSYLAVINPSQSGTASLAYCTYLSSAATSIAVDSSGNASLAGPGSVTRINPALSGSLALVYSTALPSSFARIGLLSAIHGNEFYNVPGPAIAVDASGNAYVTGYATSASFPVTPGAYETSSGITSKTAGVAFVTKLNGAGGLVYSTFLGTAAATGSQGYTCETVGTSIAVDAAGDAYVTGMTGSSKFPLVNPIQKTYGGNGDAFVTELNPSGTGLLFSTYLGGAQTDIPMGIGLDASGNVYVAGITGSINFPATPGAYQTSFGSAWTRGFVARIGGLPASPIPARASSAATSVGGRTVSTNVPAMFGASLTSLGSSSFAGVALASNPPVGMAQPMASPELARLLVLGVSPMTGESLLAKPSGRSGPLTRPLSHRAGNLDTLSDGPDQGTTDGSDLFLRW